LRGRAGGRAHGRAGAFVDIAPRSHRPHALQSRGWRVGEGTPQKLQNGAFILADLAGRDQTLSEDQLDNIFIALTNLIEPFEFAESGSAIVTSVSGDSTGHADVNWQRSGAGALEATSAVGAPGEEASLPDTLSIGDGETIIVCEVFYDFVPLFGLTTSSRLIHRMAYLKPRLGTLETLLP
jgi:hypothetical protein